MNTTSTNPVTIDAPEGVPFIDMTREFDAPVEAVYRAHHDPDLAQQWTGPRGYEMDVESWDVRTGGRYRFVHKDGDGGEYAFNGVHHVVRENELIIRTFEFEGYPDVVSIETLTFEDLGGGRTRLQGHSTFPSQEARDGMVASGMEHGVTQGYEQLDELLARL